MNKGEKTVDFLLMARRDNAAALRFFGKAMTLMASGAPKKVTMDKSGANKAAIDEINARGEMRISPPKHVHQPATRQNPYIGHQTKKPATD
jgi:putative transposase